MAYALVAATAAASTNLDSVTTSGIDTTGADLLVMAVSYGTTTYTTSDISDSKGNSWTQLTAYESGTLGIRFFYSKPISVGSGHTVTASLTGTAPGIAFLAVSGSATIPFNVQNGAGVSSPTTTAQPGSVTPTEANSMFVTAVEYGGTNNGAVTINSGFSKYAGVNVNPGQGFGIILAVAIGSSILNPTWDASGESASLFSLNIAVFKPLVAPSGGNYYGDVGYY